MDKISYGIRLAHRDDIASIQALISANPRTIVPRLSQEFDELLPTFWVAEQKGKIVGCVCLEVYSAKICEVRTLIVDESVRHRGIGQELLRHAIAEAQSRKIPQILVITSDPAYFEKMNFGPDLNEKFALFYQGPRLAK